MRITNNMMSNNYLRALNSSLSRQSAIQEQLTDGKAIHRPSDDPIKTARSLRFNTNLAENEQYTQNVNDSTSWMENTDGAMSDLSSLMIRIKELTVNADDTKTPDALNAIGAEVDQLINQAVSIGNTKVGNRYIFAGQMDSTQPFERKTITDPNSNKTMDVVIYNGDMNKISMVLKPGIVKPTEDGINLTGSDVFGPLEYNYGQPTMGIFNDLISLKQELQRTSPISQTAGAVGTATVGGVYTGTGYTNYDVRIDGVDGLNQVTGASYSTDGGNTWNAAVGFTAGNPSTATLSDGVTLSMQAAVGNAANGTYSFRVPAGSTSSADAAWISNVALSNVDAAHDSQLRMHTELGARMATYEMAKNILENNNVIITSDTSLNEDLDIPAAIIDQKNSENVYKAALSVGAKIIPLSLVDFLN